MSKRIKGPVQRTPEWYAERHFHIGASEAAKAVNRSRWGNRVTLYHEKTQQLTSEASKQAQLGLRLEPVILDIAERELPIVYPELEDLVRDDGTVRVRRNIPMYWLEDQPWVSCSPDGMLISGRGAVDAKATFHSANLAQWGESGTDNIPEEYIFQAQQQCVVMGVPCVYFPVFFGIGEVKLYRVDRNEQLCEALLRAEAELWQNIVTGVPPEPDWEDPKVLEQVRQLHSKVEPVTVELDDSWFDVYREFMELSTIEATAKREKDERLAKLLHAMGDAQTARIPGAAEELHRIQVQESLVTEEDVVALQQRIGQVKRKGYVTTRWKKIAKR